jgi:murein L,D-transpeptidase YcbB/YkuD
MSPRAARPSLSLVIARSCLAAAGLVAAALGTPPGAQPTASGPGSSRVAGAQEASDSVMPRVREMLQALRLPRAKWPRIGDVASALRPLYDSTATAPLWLRDGLPTANARTAIRYLAQVETVGLAAVDYDAQSLDSLGATLAGAGMAGSAAERARFEATLSVAVARVLATLQWGRVNPRDVHENFPIIRDDYDLTAAVRRVATGSDPLRVFGEAEPPLLHYRLLKAQLARYRQLAGDSTEAAARTRMNTRLRQMELSLERWRWLPHAFPGRVIIVNVPEFRLHAFDRLTADSTALFSMDVVVGEAYDHQTPIFMKEIEHLAFSPYWEVPPSIARKEIKPKAVRSPSYLRRNHYVLLRGGVEVPHTAANIAAIGASVRVRQLPGSDNALGRVKFIFPNPHNVYMHDTPVQSAFERDRRDLSHGCIRLADPVRLATWILRDRPEWTAAALDSAMSRATPLDVRVTERIPVLVLYGTAIAERSGEMRFYRDIYGHDRTLSAMLARGYPYPR